MPSILKAEELVSYIGLYTILQGVNVDVAEGDIVTILGRNGAGKTTFLKTIMGMVDVRSGKLELGGRSIVGKPTYDIARMGVGYVPEDYGVFDALTVQENLRLPMWKPDQASWDRVAYVLDLFPDLKAAYKRPARSLSGGQRQMLSVGRSMVNDNKIILVDEPSKGLAPVIIEKMGLAFIEIAKTRTILLVEQNFALACAVAKRYYIVNEGRTIQSGLVKDLMHDTETQKQYLGI
jgi:branched-chain amino acid transport system ATP-binding protein